MSGSSSERPSPNALLKSGPNRSVFVRGGEPDGDGAVRVVKRFHARGRLARLRDGRRARHEFAVLRALRERGLPVPEPIVARRGPAGWELVSAWIPGALPVQALLDGDAPAPVPIERLARELGRLVARTQRAGLEQRDPHAGNALVDGEGRVWLVDFTKARLRRRRSGARDLRELVTLAAKTREAWSFGLRARFFLAWLEERGGVPRAERNRLARRIERSARAVRRRIARASVDRWLRESGVCRVVECSGERYLVARWLGRVAGERWLAECSRASTAKGSERGAAWIETGRALDRIWRTMGRAADQRLACARPIVRRVDREPCALFELPEGARSVRGLVDGADSGLRRRVARSAGALAGSLHDRGLGLAEPFLDALIADERGALRLGPRARLARSSSRAPWRAWSRAFRAFAPGRLERASFVAGFVSSARGGPAERRRLRVELARG